jgi:osomolarity two-component system sensor histidine kinase CHK1
VFDYFKGIRPVTVQAGDDTGKLWIQLHTQGMCNMMGDGNTDPSNLEGVYFGNRTVVNKILESHSAELKYAYYVLKLVLAVIHRYKYVAAEIICSDLPKLISQVPVTVYHVMVTFYGALAIIDKSARTEVESELLNGFIQDLQDWSNTCPSMFLHKYLLLKAELEKGSNNIILTLDTYEDAIKYALAEGFVQEAAIINERCGDFLQLHSKQRSLIYLREACRLYTLWGAQKKITQLTTRYPELMESSYDLPRLSLSSSDLATSANLRPGLRHRSSLTSNNVLVQNSSPLRWILSNLFREESMDEGQNGDSGKNQVSSMTNREREGSSVSEQAVVVREDNSASGQNANNNRQGEQDLELKTALQACLDISESIDMNSITVKLIESVMKTSAADYCVYVSLDEDGELYVDSVGVLNGVKIIDHEPLFVRTDVAPINVVQQVISTGSSVVRSSDAKRFDTVYGRDHYFNNRRSQSVLCMPIQNQIKVIGALYLEHQSLPTVFSLPRIELIGLLCTQAAVSIDKARLYYQMDLAKKTAEEATAEKASFLANMSHEIRTPFNALLSCSIFLLDTDLSEMQREYVETIRSSAVVTLNIIDAILAFSKIEHGSITLDNSPFSLRECVESAVQLVAEPAATKDLELVHLNKCGEIDTIYGDVTRVRQIIINLVGNAVKFTSKGHIVVETTCEKVSSDNRYEFIISVADTGIGIPKSARNKIFRAFSQVDGSSRRKFGGSGLGLAISKKLAELMGGNLTFDSKEGEGTIFWFTLIAMAQRPSTQDVRLYQGKKCLISDHHQTAKESLQTEIERLGFEVDHCSSSYDAELIVKEKKPDYYDLVFMDSKLLDTDTCLECKRIKDYSPGSQVIYMTIFGSSIPDNTEEKGISAILMRPVQRSRLNQIIRKVLHSSFNLQNQVKSAATTFDKGMIQTLAVRHPLKILLAEDNVINTRVALQHLKRMGYDADHAKDGVAVLEMCEREINEGRQMYDCILMDIQMPKKDGIAAAEDLRAKYNERTRPSVIALTANAAGEDRQNCLNAGMMNYIAKPILPTDLAAVLMGVKPLKERMKSPA